MTDTTQNEAAQLVIGMVIVGLIVFGIVGSFVMKWIEDRAVDDSVNLMPATPDPIEVPLPLSQPPLKRAQLPIAAPQTPHNDTVVIGPAVQRLADLTNDDPLMLQGAIYALARLVAAEQATQTAAIKIGLGIPPGSRSPRYEAAKAALLAEVGEINGPGEIVGFAPDPDNENRHVPVRV